MPPKLITNLVTIEEEEFLFDKYNSIRTRESSRESNTSSLSSIEEEQQQHEQQHEQQQQTRRQQQKNVSFDPIPDIIEIDHINDMKQNININDIWYSDNEYEKIHSDCERTILFMNNGYYDFLHNNDNDNEQQQRYYCIRGLEKFTIDGRKKSKYNIHTAVNAVLVEQNNQRIDGINDIEYLADIYFQQSWECQITSQTQGQYDHQVIVIMQLEEKRLLQMIKQLAFL